MKKLLLSFVLTLMLSPLYAHTVDDLMIASKNDRASSVKQMLSDGMSPNVHEQKRGDTPLIIAMREESLEVMAVLLENKQTDVNLTAFNGDDALMIACYKGNEKAVLALIDHGARINKDGWTALHYAAANGNENIVRLLLKKDAFVNAVSPNGTTPVMMASRNGHINVVKILNDNGADLTIKNQYGYTAIDFANENKNNEISKGIQYLIKKETELDNKRNLMPQFPF